MSPFIKDGDVITLSPLLEVPLKYGDVVAFINPETEKLFVHRIVGREKDFYLIKGDNSCETEGFVSKENIFGRVTKVERNGKRAFLGFGPERFLIARLNRKRLPLPLLFPIRILICPIVRRLVT